MAKKKKDKKSEFKFDLYIEEHKFVIAGILLCLIVVSSIILFWKMNLEKPGLEARIAGLEKKVFEIEKGKTDRKEIPVAKVDVPVEKSEPVIDEMPREKEVKEIAKTTISSFININTASQTELETLSGIGPVRAKAIMDYRQNKGSFRSIEEIKNITGIGEAIFLKIKDRISI